MIDIIEVNTTDCEITKLLDRRRAFDVSEHCRLWFKSERNESAESARFVLELAKLPQMIDPLLERFDVAVKHRAGTATAHLMPRPVHFQPFLGRFLAPANSVSDAGIENFGAATSDGAEAMLPQQLQRVSDGHFEDAVSEMTCLDRGKSLNVQL